MQRHRDTGDEKDVVFNAHWSEPAVFPDLQRGHLMPFMSDRVQCRLE